MRPCVLLGLILGVAGAVFTPNRMEDTLLRRALHQCSLAGSKYSCLAEKAAKVMERALDADVPLFDGITLTRNPSGNDSIPRDSARGFDRLSSVVSRFLETHVVTLDLTENEEEEDGDVVTGREGGEEKKKKKDKKEKKYAYYALMVLLGIFGIIGPLTLKTLALIAGKALIASKIALLIVGSVALKKIFEKDAHSSVKIHTHTIDHDDYHHDRVYNYNHIPVTYGAEKGPAE